MQKKIDDFFYEPINDIDEDIRKVSEIDRWIIVVGSKYKNGKIEPPGDDLYIAKKIQNKFNETLSKESQEINKNPIKNRGCINTEIINDTEIYFSEKKIANLIVVGGTSINKITLDLNKKLPITYMKIKSHVDENYHNYLVNRKDYEGEWKTYEQIKNFGSIQIIKNPYNQNKNDVTFIIVIFGLDRYGTEIAANQLIKWRTDLFTNLKKHNYTILVGFQEENETANLVEE